MTLQKQAEKIGISRRQYHNRIKNWSMRLFDDAGVEYIVSPKHCMVKPKHIKTKDKE